MLGGWSGGFGIEWGAEEDYAGWIDWIGFHFCDDEDMNQRLDDKLARQLPPEWGEKERTQARTLFYKALSLLAHRHYGGKIQTFPRADLPNADWFNVWYTPGVSAVSTDIRDAGDDSFDLTSRGQTVAVLSDGTRVLGDGDVTPAGGMGVMEGKAYLMKMLGGVDAVPVCVDSRNAEGKPDADVLIDLAMRLSPSFGAINLEDISQPNCFRVLDALRERCPIPVWHDDAQGTGCVTVAGVLNALAVTGKEIGNVRFALNGAGAANTTIARLLIAAGADPEKMALFDTKGGLHAGRADLEADARFYRKWELCRTTNPGRVERLEEWLRGADVLISLSRSGPGVIPGEWIAGMAAGAVVFACANPVPEIYPHEAKAAGAAVVATGRGDFPNQVNNSVGFPGILKGVLLVRARKISDGMALAAARAIAAAAGRGGALGPERIMPSMDEVGVHADVAAAVAEQARVEGLARRPLEKETVRAMTERDILRTRQAFADLKETGFIAEPPESLMDEAIRLAVRGVRETNEKL